MENLTRDDVEEIPLGFYLIFWEGGGMSKAMISVNRRGVRIINCLNWPANSYNAPLVDYVDDIEKMIFIM